MRNDFYIGMYEDNYLTHSAKGTTKANHLYISRVWKNGKWNYIYDYNNPLFKAMAKGPEANTAASTTKSSTSKTKSTKTSTKNGVATIKSSKSSSKKSSSTKKKKTKKSKGASSSKSSSSSKQAKEKTAKTSGSGSSKAVAQQKVQKTVNGNKVKDFSVQNSTSDMMKAINKFKDGSKGYVSVNGKVYLWSKSGGKLTFNNYGDTKTKLNQQSVISEIDEVLKKKKNGIAVDKYKK